MCEETPNVDKACRTYLEGEGVKKVDHDVLLISHGSSVWDMHININFIGLLKEMVYV